MPDIEEIEVKFVVEEDPTTLRRRILALGARPRGRYHEFNYRLDDDHSSLSDDNIQLRIRHAVDGEDTFSKLTVKTRSIDDDPNFKIRREIEMLVDDHKALLAALEVMGYTPYWHYEKWREKFALGRVVITLDELAIGWFMEIEGPKGDIVSTAELLGLNMGESLTCSYSKLFKVAVEELDLDHTDLTFEALAGVTVDPTIYYSLRKVV